MTDAWRVIPNFKRYEITEDGDVRNRKTKLRLKEVSIKGGYFAYNLYANDGKMVQRSFWGLVYSAYPELLDGWRPIPGFPNHIFNRRGQVQSRAQYKILKPVAKNGTVRLHQDGKIHRWHINHLGLNTKEAWDAFWAKEKEVA